MRTEAALVRTTTMGLVYELGRAVSRLVKPLA